MTNHSSTLRFSLKALSLAVLTALTTTVSFAEYKVEITDTIPLPGKLSTGTPYNHYTRLILNDSGDSVYGVSDEDESIRGYALYGRATRWSGTNYATKTDLGSLKANNSQSSQITDIAQDGKILVGFGHHDTDIADGVHGGIWSGTNHANKKDLLTSDYPLWGDSYVYAVSGDGQVIAGSSSGYSELAIINNNRNDWTSATYLPKLPHQPPRLMDVDDSTVLALNYDGSVAVGASISNFTDSTNSSNIRPVAWTGNNWQTLTDLGTLKADNLGTGMATAISDDGKIIGGYSDVDDRASSAATIWTGDAWQTKIRLKGIDYAGDPYHNSTAIYTLSKDGKIAGGTSTDPNKLDNSRPVIWSGDNYEVITDLGTLDKDLLGANRLAGIVTSFNDDSTIIAGFSEDNDNSSGSWKPVVWKVKYTSTTPTPTPIIIGKIDVVNTAGTINKIGQDSFSLIAMQSRALDRLQYSCTNYQGACFGVQQDFSFSKDLNGNHNRDVATGVNLGYGFDNGFSVGVSLDHSINRKLPDSYRHHRNGVGVGVVLRYQAPQSYFGEITGAYDNYTATITRPTLANTELGVNEADIKGLAYGAKFGKNFGSNQNYRLYAGAKFQDISRAAYTENDHTTFPISYGKLQYKQSLAVIGANARLPLNSHLAWVSHAEIERHLSGDDFVYQASFTGVDKHDFNHTITPVKTQGYLATGIQYNFSPAMSMTLTPYINKNITGKNDTGLLFRLESAF